jgi:ribulose 1,5-bisphosphate synthetase/thiazole synthase
LVAAYYLTRGGYKVSLFERKLSIGGGMWGGGMLMSGEKAAALIGERLKKD